MNNETLNRLTNVCCYGTLTSFKVRKGTITHVRLSLAAAAAAGIKAGTRVSVRPVEISGPNNVTKFGIEIVTSKFGIKVGKHGNGLLIQKSGLFHNSFPSVPAIMSCAKEGRIVVIPTFPANENRKTRPVCKAEPARIAAGAIWTPDFLGSLSIDPGWKRRRDMLAGIKADVRTTPAGDQCYTAGFIPRLVLKAANRTAFDIDVCSMQQDGRYDIGVRRVSKRTWGSTPEQFRKDRHVVAHVPAKRHFTNDRPFGSLARRWDGKFIWLNPPYSLRAWATFLEYAHLQVEQGNAETIVALVPRDDMGPHNRHFYSEHAYRIEITRDIPFFKREKRNKEGKIIARNVIDVIQGTQFVVFGKGKETKQFLENFLHELRSIDYISEQHLARYMTLFGLRRAWQDERSLTKRKLAA